MAAAPKIKTCDVLYYGNTAYSISYEHKFGVPRGTPVGQVKDWLCRRLGVPKRLIFFFDKKNGDMVSDKIRSHVFIAQFGDDNAKGIHYETRVELGAQFDTLNPQPRSYARRYHTSKHSKPSKKPTTSFGFID